MKTLFFNLVVSLITVFSFLSCKDEKVEKVEKVIDYRYKYVGNYEFKTLKIECSFGRAIGDTLINYVGTIKCFSGDDYLYEGLIVHNPDFSFKFNYVSSYNKIKIQYQKDEIIIFEVLESGQFIRHHDCIDYDFKGGFLSNDTVKFYTRAGNRHSFEQTVIGIRKY